MLIYYASFKVTVGMPPYNEVILSGGQLKSKGLRHIIHKAYYGDESMAMLSQVILEKKLK